VFICEDNVDGVREDEAVDTTDGIEDALLCGGALIWVEANGPETWDLSDLFTWMELTAGLKRSVVGRMSRVGSAAIRRAMSPALLGGGLIA